ncbi:MAG TPA: heme exporter protein CcmD [Beijerinckiaceae bacterium]|jgi:heme exporter protein D
MSSHGGFILAAYAVTALVLAALILRAVIGERRVRRQLAELESRGARRRSGTPSRTAASP